MDVFRKGLVPAVRRRRAAFGFGGGILVTANSAATDAGTARGLCVLSNGPFVLLLSGLLLWRFLEAALKLGLLVGISTGLEGREAGAVIRLVGVVGLDVSSSLFGLVVWLSLWTVLGVSRTGAERGRDGPSPAPTSTLFSLTLVSDLDDCLRCNVNARGTIILFGGWRCA
jgi:hypothetical protein